MDYKAALDYINSFINFENIPRYNYASSFNLERMHAFLRELGNPHKFLNVVHVAGSKGKGSACCIIASILRQAGYRVGLYTSPHLLDERERIRVLTRRPTSVVSASTEALLLRQGFVGQVSPSVSADRHRSGDFEGAIRRDELVELIKRIKVAAEKFRDHKELGRLSFFEILTACAFLHFKEKEVNIAILETGIGGRLDATNVTMPLVCGITNISLEHTDKLGNSLKSIASEKAGIIKARGVVVSAPQEKAAIGVIRKVCRGKESILYEIGKDVNYSIINLGENTQVFDLEGPGYSYKNLELNLIGAHQSENASLGIAMIKCMDKGMFRIDEEAIRTGLKNATWPGRLELIQKEPYVILDGAQNAVSIKRALSSIKEIFYYKRLISVFGISRDKDIEGVSRELDRSSRVVILTRSRNIRAKEAFDLKENFSRAALEVTTNVEEALGLSLRIANKEDLILVTGSLFVVGEAIEFLQGGALKRLV